MSALRPGWAIVLLTLGASQLAPGWEGGVALPALIVAAVLPLPYLALLTRARIASAAAGLLVLVSGLGIGWWELHKAGVTPTDSVPRLLTIAPPAPTMMSYLVPGLCLCWLVGTFVALGVLATGRRSAAVAPVLGTVALYGAGALLTAGSADRNGLVAAGILLVAVLGWALLDAAGDGSSLPALRRSTGSALGLLVLVAVGLLATATLPSAHAFQPREHVQPPSVRIEESNPMTLLASWERNPAVEILRVQASGTDRIRLVTLAQYTGDSWRVSADYRAVGSIAGPSLPPGAVQQPAQASIQVVQLGGHWLPTAGSAKSVSLNQAYLDPESGALALQSELTTGVKYTVEGEVDAPPDQALQGAGLAAVPAAYLDVAQLPLNFAQYAQQAVLGASTPFEQAVAIEHAVTTGRQLLPDSPTGTSYSRLQAFMFGAAGAAGAQVGSSQQFAAAFAVLARSVGLPTRLVVGFSLGKAGTDGQTVVHGSDAEAWPEVYFASAGWVAFDPTPGGTAGDKDAAARRLVLDKLSKLPPPAPPPTNAPLAVPSPTAGSGSSATNVLAGQGISWSRVAQRAIVVLVLAILLGVLALRSLRRHRHRGRGPRGAWAETLDLMLLLGHRVPKSMTAPAMAESLSTVLPASSLEAARVVAAAADQSAFGPVADEIAVWDQVRVLRRGVSRTLPWYRRPTLGIDPRPLFCRDASARGVVRERKPTSTVPVAHR